MFHCLGLSRARHFYGVSNKVHVPWTQNIISLITTKEVIPAINCRFPENCTGTTPRKNPFSGIHMFVKFALADRKTKPLLSTLESLIRN